MNTKGTPLRQEVLFHNHTMAKTDSSNRISIFRSECPPFDLGDDFKLWLHNTACALRRILVGVSMAVNYLRGPELAPGFLVSSVSTSEGPSSAPHCSVVVAGVLSKALRLPGRCDDLNCGDLNCDAA